MKSSNFLAKAVLFLALATSLTSCFTTEDPGPMQSAEKEYSLEGFDRLEIGDALDVTVTQGASFSVKVEGDRRNLDDLEVVKVGNTLRIRFFHSNNRRYETQVKVVMPSINGAIFSGAVEADIYGFQNDSDFDLTLSGASEAKVNMTAPLMKVNLSGSSELQVAGSAADLSATVSGASELHAYDLISQNSTVDASGASTVHVYAAKKLKAIASGASDIRYRGSPVVDASSSGASTIAAD